MVRRLCSFAILRDEAVHDFHLHTRCSDGALTPRELLDAVEATRLTSVSITDHDTIAAYDDLPAELYRGDVPRIVPGVEFSTSRSEREIHILGYFPRGFDAAARSLVERAGAARRERIARGLGRLRERGVEITMDDCRDDGGAIVCRSHLAAWLVQRRYAMGHRDAFQRLLGAGSFPSSPLATGEVVQAIGAAGGIAIWAHPSEADVERFLDDFVSAGLRGLEVETPARTRAARSRLRRVAEARELVVTGGSDWHRPGGGRRALGQFAVAPEAVREFLALLDRFRQS